MNSINHNRPSSAKVSVPVLLLFFNRLDTTIAVLDRIREVKPKKMYLASDGARNHIQNEFNVVKEIRQYILDNIDWDCQVETLFRAENLGCKYAVHSAVQWFFAQEEKGIVLEDDIIPTVNFFSYCEEMLEMYKDDKSVGAITGRNDLGVFDTAHIQDYFFSTKFFCWGWASWSDRVLDNEVELDGATSFYKEFVKKIPLKERLLVQGMLGLIRSNQVNSWAYPYDLSFRLKEQLCLVPSMNMIRNIGLEIIGAHSNGTGIDSIAFYDSFRPKFNSEISMDKNNLFMNEWINKRYPFFALLFIFSKIKYLGWVRKIIKRRKVSF